MESTPPPLAAGIPVFCAFHQLVSIHELKPRPGNPHEHPDGQLVLYAAAIRARGWREAITVSRQSGFIVAGHGGLLAARKLGVDLVPVEFQDYASEDEELADLAEALKPLLERLSLGGFALSAGYGAEVVSKLLTEMAPKSG